MPTRIVRRVVRPTRVGARRPGGRPAPGPRRGIRPSTPPVRSSEGRRIPIRGEAKRLVTLLLLVSVAFLAIGARLVDVQTRAQDHYRRLGLDQRVRTVSLAAERGSIFDRNGNELAVSVERKTVYADPRVVGDPAEYAAKLAPLVGVDEGQLRSRLSQPGAAFVYVARKVENDVAARVRALDLPGVGFVPETRRYYPTGSLAAPLLGFVGLDNDGLAGLEAGYERLLAGRQGSVIAEQDPTGRRLPDGIRNIRDARRGEDIVLTVDESIQYQTERALLDEVVAAKAAGGFAVVADVRTGDVLAMATVEGSTPDRAARPAPSTAHNRPLTDVFEPGSTSKVVTIAAALEEGLVNPETRLEVPQRIVVDGTKFEDIATHSLSMTVADVLRESSNVGTILVARMLGKERFDAYLRRFGFGEGTGLEFPGEAPGILLPLEQYNATSLASMPVGSGLAVTAMQLLDVYMVLANDGVAREPRLISSTIDADGERDVAPPSRTHRVVSSGTASQMVAMLERVVREGTGVKASIPGYRVAGKTGTARKPPYEKPPYKYVASFAGFAPADTPRLAAIVVLDEPQSAVYGSRVAAPVFARIMQYALRVERVPPSGS